MCCCAVKKLLTDSEFVDTAIIVHTCAQLVPVYLIERQWTDPVFIRTLSCFCYNVHKLS